MAGLTHFVAKWKRNCTIDGKGGVLTWWVKRECIWYWLLIFPPPAGFFHYHRLFSPWHGRNWCGALKKSLRCSQGFDPFKTNISDTWWIACATLRWAKSLPESCDYDERDSLQLFIGCWCFGILVRSQHKSFQSILCLLCLTTRKGMVGFFFCCISQCWETRKGHSMPVFH